MEDPDTKIVEQVANKVHNVWSRWLKYMFSNGKFNKDGSFTMSPSLVDKWTRQMNTIYVDLSEKEKSSDRIIAHGYIDVFRKLLMSRIKKEPK